MTHNLYNNKGYKLACLGSYSNIVHFHSNLNYFLRAPKKKILSAESIEEVRIEVGGGAKPIFG